MYCRERVLFDPKERLLSGPDSEMTSSASRDAEVKAGHHLGDGLLS